MVDVSIIVPVYNVEKYLKKCLDSLVKQTFKNLEIIVVNDGSIDNSQAIIDSYQKKYPNLIKSFNKKNGGLSDARNFGIKKARGKYLMFVDSDDYVTDDMVEKLYNCLINTNSDMALCNYIRVNYKGEEIKNYNYNPGVVNVYQDKKILLNKQTACNKIYKKELFNNLKFDVGKYYEDLRLINKLYLLCNKVAFIDDFCYYYIERNNSIMKDCDLKKSLDIIEAIESLINFYKVKGAYDSFKEEIEFMMIDNIIIDTFRRIICSYKKVGWILDDYWKFINNNFPNYRKNKYLKTLSWKRRLVYFCNSHKLYIITKILFKLKG